MASLLAFTEKGLNNKAATPATVTRERIAAPRNPQLKRRKRIPPRQHASMVSCVINTADIPGLKFAR